jgi:hypothetical protein
VQNSILMTKKRPPAGARALMGLHLPSQLLGMPEVTSASKQAALKTVDPPRNVDHATAMDDSTERAAVRALEREGANLDNKKFFES